MKALFIFFALIMATYTSFGIDIDTINADTTSLIDSSLLDSKDTIPIYKNIILLLEEATKYIEKANEPKSWFVKTMESSSKLIGLLISILTLIASYFGLKKTNLFEKYKNQIIFILWIVFALILSALFIDALTTVILLIGVIIFSVILVLYILLEYVKHLDSEDYNLKERLLKLLNIEPQKSRKLKNDKESLYEINAVMTKAMLDLLQSVLDQMISKNETKISIPFSYIEEYDIMMIELIPNEMSYPKWRNLENKILIPENVSIVFARKIENGNSDKEKQEFEFCELINFQTSFAVVRDLDKKNMRFVKLNQQGILDASQYLYEKAQKELTKIFHDLDKITNSSALYKL